MSKYIGRLVNLGIAKESSRGVAVAAAHWIPKSKVAFFDRATKLVSKQSYGVIGDGNLAPKSMEWAEGSIEGDFEDRGMGLILLGLFGAETPSGPTDSAYTHTYSLANTNTHQSLTLTLQDPDREDLYSLSMVDSLEVNVVPDDVVSFVASFKARTGRAAAVQSPSYVAGNKFIGRMAHIKIASLASGLTAAAELNLKSFKMKINKNTVLNNVMGTVWPDDILNTKFEITGTFELDLTDQTYRQYMLDGSYKAMRFDMQNRDVLIGTATIPGFTLDLSRVEFEAWEVTRDNDAIVTQKISFRGLYDITNSNIINSCTLVNNIASY